MEVWMYARRIPAINKAVEAGKLSTANGMSKEGVQLQPSTISQR
jgi:hypothetical protein